MRRNNTTQIRIYTDTKDKILSTSRLLSEIHKQQIYSAEVLRRIANIPNIKDILLDDAKIKMELKKYGK